MSEPIGGMSCKLRFAFLHFIISVKIIGCFTKNAKTINQLQKREAIKKLAIIRDAPTIEEREKLE
ncbi:hypothetical protein [Methylotenera sp.]|uniref:hypothetical protein n=1 Tax=Methylotenera sp. TaxID=2051956 RepID=UPI002ED8E191